MNEPLPVLCDRTSYISNADLRANEIEDIAHEVKTVSLPKAHSILRQHLASIGGKSLAIEMPGPNGSSLCWYSMRNHIVILQTFDDGERWEIYTSLSAGNKASLADACSGLASLVTR
jgi:hypothetical protein